MNHHDPAAIGLKMSYLYDCEVLKTRYSYIMTLQGKKGPRVELWLRCSIYY
jgi:hypothetical protein